MDRRRFVALIGGVLTTPRAFAQQSGAKTRIGLLISEPLAGQAVRVEALRAGLRERGYVEGREFAFELRSAEGAYDRLPGLAAELVHLRPDVIVTFGSKAAVAARTVTSTIPIVVPLIGDPVGLGLAGSLARPGGNLTGIAVLSPQVAAKRVEFLKEASPKLRRIAHLQNPANLSNDILLKVYQNAAGALKLELRTFEAHSPKDFAAAFVAMAKANVDGVAVSADTLFRSNIAQVAALALQHRLSTVGAPEFADAGCLIGYGAVDVEMYRRGAYFVDRILKGARPADLPVEQPTKFDLTINMNTAKALGLAVPGSLLLRADRVIE